MLITEPLSKAEMTLIQMAERLYQQEVAKLDEGRKACLQSIYDSHGILPGTKVDFAQSGPGEFVLFYDKSEPSTGKDESIDEIAAEIQAPIPTKPVKKAAANAKGVK